jgi:hypothetical protein
MTDTNAIVDGCARVIADAVDGTVFAAGVTAVVTAAETRVVPIADDWSEVGFPIVTVYLGPWAGTLQPGNERLKVTLNCAIWRERAELGVNTAALYADRDALADAWIARTKAYLAEATLQSAVLMGGSGILPVDVPSGQRSRELLSLPFTVDVVCNRTVSAQPA